MGTAYPLRFLHRFFERFRFSIDTQSGHYRWLHWGFSGRYSLWFSCFDSVFEVDLPLQAYLPTAMNPVALMLGDFLDASALASS